MCGIIAYKGFRDGVNIVLEGLKLLEYRGYDSWGIAAKNEDIHVFKEVGKIGEIKKVNLLRSNICMGHTRWSTTGAVTKENSHPHLSCDNKIAVIHNGIIENYEELKKQLKNHNFASETDTEVIPHLIEENINLGFFEAVKKAANLIEGRSAFIAINKDNDEMIAVRTGAPLILGIGNNEYFIASDVPAFLDYTKDVNYLDDNEMVVIKDHPNFFNFRTGEEIKKRLITISWDKEQSKKGDYKHYLIKEIMEQKETINKAINQDEQEIQKIADEINNAFGTFFVGCGTSGKVCHAGEYLFSKIAKKHVNFVIASEFSNYHHFLTDETLMIVVTQSGETADVIEAIEAAKKENVKIISLVNVQGSTISLKSDYSLLVKAGPEKAVASTKTATSQLALLLLLAYASIGKLKEGKRLLIETSSMINDMLNLRYEEHIKRLAELIHKKEHAYIIGKSSNYPMALESAIKIQEVSYMHAEGFAAGELKHGPIALIEKNTPCIALVANDETKKDVLVNAQELKTRGAYIIGVAPEYNKIFDYWIKVPDAGDASPIVNIIPIQILSYHLALLRGHDPDYPRNLAKGVTVK
ncbi:glutamine--fructose-6-phosphate transaminase (isomerizing) [Candidatus Woesearchaeota archaeon]|nr:glutamine--fructose-6-phosphate transaminase (isomerizing) [Candidatus Woesearchaeota archaeon]